MENNDFWLRYLRLHSDPKTRAMHFMGTALAIVFLLAAAAMQSWWPFLLAILFGYGFATTSHYIVEKNKPAALGRPFLSLISDFRMFFLWCFGRLDAELRKAGVET